MNEGCTIAFFKTVLVEGPAVIHFGFGYTEDSSACSIVHYIVLLKSVVNKFRNVSIKIQANTIYLSNK